MHDLNRRVDLVLACNLKATCRYNDSGRKVVTQSARAQCFDTVRVHLAMRTRSPHGASPGAACDAGVRGRRLPPSALHVRCLRIRIIRPICPMGRY